MEMEEGAIRWREAASGKIQAADAMRSKLATGGSEAACFLVFVRCNQ
jgi:hypothetical protein